MCLKFIAKSSLLFIFACSLLCVITVRADELHMKDGRVIEAEEIWEVGDAIWYRQGKIISSCAKTDVVRITKPKPASEPAPASSTTNDPTSPVGPKAKVTTLVDESSSGSSGEEIATRNVSRIILKGGMQIDADAVWEDANRVGYRLGKMQTFIDRVDVERVIREVTINEQKSIASSPQFRYTTGHLGLDQLIVYSAEKYGLDPTLIYLVMREESGFNHRAVSRVGARGLMQLMPGTAARLGVRNIHDPVQNVEAGTRYLRSLLEMFNGDVNLALAAYNAGENAVLKYGRRIPPYRETMNYVWRINTAYRRAMAPHQSGK
jgi:hypothetical protein